MVIYVIQNNGGTENSPDSLNVMVNYHYHGENRVITRQFPSMGPTGQLPGTPGRGPRSMRLTSPPWYPAPNTRSGVSIPEGLPQTSTGSPRYALNPERHRPCGDLKRSCTGPPGACP